ncbi:hypothetical protein BELL_1047g00010 [Botrytis elliptica]|uniref:Uncharacterized protein n=1 Tax=Botrytis elliptica TaxID=278938 RepID=A0A4Z1IUD7_9HELO|nr:hypothetical protein EAE99_007846 [Botrytis elliptica]TGO64304.1 hypothetical protein BELL_1047g00010 [Botrytis elliptica]
MSNQPEKEDSSFQCLPPLPQLPQWGILSPESPPPDSIGRTFGFPTSSVRDGPPVAHDRSPASGIDAPNMVVSDRAEPDRGRSASGLLRAGGSLRGRPPNPHDPYDMNRYHAIHNNARTSYPVNSDTTMNNDPASNLPPYNSDFVNGARGRSPYHTRRSLPFERRPVSVTDQSYPFSAARRQPIPPPSLAPGTASAAVPATRMTAAPAPAPAPAPPIAPAAPAVPVVPVSSSTRSRTQKQTSAAIKKNVKKPAAKKSTAKRPSKDRTSFCIPRPKITEVELAFVRDGYGTLLARKKAFKNAPPGAYVDVEITYGEMELLWSIRANGAEERQAYHDNIKEETKEAMLKASASYERNYQQKRAKAVREGYPDAMPLADRFPVVPLAAAAALPVAPVVAPVIAPVVAPVVAPAVAGNAAESTEDQEMADDDWVPPPGGLYSDDDD